MNGRIALGLRYRGSAYRGWQSQTDGRTVQDALQKALSQFADRPVTVTCAGRTDTGVHGLNQVVHLDPGVHRLPASWVRGGNRYLPNDIAIQWCVPVSDEFHARFSAVSRRYRYLLFESPVRPSIDVGLVGWSFRALDAQAMHEAARCLIGEHDFSSFRSAECQARSPVKTLHSVRINRHGSHWCCDFHGNAFLHHMIRNLMGCLVAIGSGAKPPPWMAEVLLARDRKRAAPTFAADGLYFVGPQYDAAHGIAEFPPEHALVGQP